MRKRRHYTRKFKQQAVAQTRAKGASISQVARDLGITRSALSRWRREADMAEAMQNHPWNSQRQQEIDALQQDLTRVREELDALIENLPGARKGK